MIITKQVVTNINNPTFERNSREILDLTYIALSGETKAQCNMKVQGNDLSLEGSGINMREVLCLF